ncbi:MAG: hypothetical protein HY894_01780 [Deltaproteobacteria bacterium]|nr:hypothetical protein [Deltaproteobacteria bacterium]
MEDAEIRFGKGAKRRFAGCVLLAVAGLDSALMLKAGTATTLFDYALIAAGAISLAAGVAAARRKQPR